MVQKESNIDSLLTHFRRNTDRVMSLNSIHELLGEGQKDVNDNIDALVEDKEIFKIGEGQYMYSNNSDLVAFEIFRGIAPQITFDEYLRYKDEEHVLMRLSRDREMLNGPLSQEESPEPKRRGNNLSL
ncbi:MAG: hypothetical protein KAS16_09560 [Thermoplasmata archaeon]|nr:hypothetical protein [Thermoplasmata archaeon]